MITIRAMQKIIKTCLLFTVVQLVCLGPALSVPSHEDTLRAVRNSRTAPGLTEEDVTIEAAVEPDTCSKPAVVSGTPASDPCCIRANLDFSFTCSKKKNKTCPDGTFEDFEIGCDSKCEKYVGGIGSVTAEVTDGDSARKGWLFDQYMETSCANVGGVAEGKRCKIENCPPGTKYTFKDKGPTIANWDNWTGCEAGSNSDGRSCTGICKEKDEVKLTAKHSYSAPPPVPPPGGGGGGGCRCVSVFGGECTTVPNRCGQIQVVCLGESNARCGYQDPGTNPQPPPVPPPGGGGGGNGGGGGSETCSCTAGANQGCTSVPSTACPEYRCPSETNHLCGNLPPPNNGGGGGGGHCCPVGGAPCLNDQNINSCNKDRSGSPITKACPCS